MSGVPVPGIEGAADLVAWFGEWPTFHDAEILELNLVRGGSSIIRLHLWRLTDRLDSAGLYLLDHHVVVSLHLEKIVDLELNGFSGQNVISGLACEASQAGVRVTMWPCYGIAGYIEAERVVVSFEPGNPRDVHRG